MPPMPATARHWVAHARKVSRLSQFDDHTGTSSPSFSEPTGTDTPSSSKSAWACPSIVAG
jgi:hypothetical protein